jgi:hypothetical protein
MKPEPDPQSGLLFQNKLLASAVEFFNPSAVKSFNPSAVAINKVSKKYVQLTSLGSQTPELSTLSLKQSFLSFLSELPYQKALQEFV